MPSKTPRVPLARLRRPDAPSAAGTVNLADGLDQPQNARSLASKAGPHRLYRARVVSLGCFLGMAVLLAVAARCPRARADEGLPPPPPTMPAALPTAAEQLAELDDLQARLLAGRARVAFYEGAARADRIARLHFREGRR